MYLLKPNKKHYVFKPTVFETAKELVEYADKNNILKFCVVKVERYVVPAPKEQNPRIELERRLVPLSQAASDEVKL